MQTENRERGNGVGSHLCRPAGVADLPAIGDELRVSLQQVIEQVVVEGKKDIPRLASGFDQQALRVSRLENLADRCFQVAHVLDGHDVSPR
jgi:hypothetical protein